MTLPLLFLIVGVLFLITAIKGNQDQLATQIEKDFTGAGSFFVWIGAILLIGVVGAAIGMPKAAKALIALMVVVFIVAQKGLFSNLQNAITNTSAPPASSSADVGAASNISSASSGSSGSGKPSSSPVNSAIGALIGKATTGGSF